MCRKLLIAGAFLLVGLFAVKKLHLDGYVSTAWKGICQEARNQIPTKFEMDRLENEIAQMDKDIERLADPLSELDFDIKVLKQEITQLARDVDRGKKALASWAEELEKGSQVVHFEGKDYTNRQVKQLAQETLTNCKLKETQLGTKRQTLEIKQKHYDALYEQANQLAGLKKQFEIELANLRAEQEKLKVEQMNAPVVQDNGRVGRIKEAMDNLKRKLGSQRTKVDLLRRPPFTTEPAPSSVNTVPEPNLEEIRSYLREDQHHVEAVNRE